VIKKDIKNLHLYVKPPDGHVEVSVPQHMSDKSIALFLRTRTGWIKKQQAKFREQPRQTEREYVSGETLYVWGKQYFLQVEYSNRKNALDFFGDRAILTVRKESTAKQRESYVNEWYRERLKAEIEKRLPRWESLTGLYCSGWQTKYMTTNWGTCNTKTGKIWINLQLAKKPFECLDYVLLHELAHLRVKDHGPAFIAILDEYMPYWRDVRKKLNDSTLDYLPEDQ
jgi:predicted metal-dependent hydrolase